MPAAVDDEARCPDDVHPLKRRRSARKPSKRHEQIGGEDEERGGPANDFDEEGNAVYFKVSRMRPNNAT